MRGVPWLHWVLIAGIAFGSVIKILLIDEPRAPLSKGVAAGELLINIALVIALVFCK